MDMLNIAFKDFRNQASSLGGYENIPLNDLANNYCKATDEGKQATRNIYFSALVLRFWFKINKMYTENLTLGIERVDCLSWLSEAILMVCEPDKRIWQKNPKISFQQALNQTLATRFVAAAYYDSNLKKNKGKHSTVSLDATLDEDESNATLLDTIPDESSYIDTSDSSVIYIIQDYINQNKIVEAIILDNVANKDVFKQEKHVIKEISPDGEEKKRTETTLTFWPFKLVKELGMLDDNYIDYFLNTYKVSQKAFEAAFKAISKANNQKKYKMVDATLADFRDFVSTLGN